MPSHYRFRPSAKKVQFAQLFSPTPATTLQQGAAALPPCFLPDSSHESEGRRAQSGLPDNPIIPTGGLISAAHPHPRQWGNSETNRTGPMGTKRTFPPFCLRLWRFARIVLAPGAQHPNPPTPPRQCWSDTARSSTLSRGWERGGWVSTASAQERRRVCVPYRFVSNHIKIAALLL